MGGNAGGAWYKNKMVMGIAVVVLIVLGFVLFSGGDKAPVKEGGVVSEVPKDTVVEPKSGEVVVTGKLGCTPLKSGATPSKDECVLGLVGNDAKFYALDYSKIETAEKGIETSEMVKAVGVFTKVDASSEEAGIFKYDGVMAVRLLLVSK